MHYQLPDAGIGIGASLNVTLNFCNSRDPLLWKHTYSLKRNIGGLFMLKAVSNTVSLCLGHCQIVGRIKI